MINEILLNLSSDDEALKNFLTNPEMFIKNETTNRDKKLIEELFMKINFAIEKAFIGCKKSNDDMFRLSRLLKEKNGSNLHKSLSKKNEKDTLSIDIECGYSTDCYYSEEQCFDWQPACHSGQTYSECPTDSTSQECYEHNCSHNPAPHQFCQDFNVCVDQSCSNAHCGDANNCWDVGACLNTLQCVDGEESCKDTGCVNSEGTNVLCQDQTNCLDEGACTNSKQCIDIGGNAVDSSCANTTFCKDTSGCGDGDCDNNGECINESQCHDEICNNVKKCTDTDCAVTYCIDAGDCFDISNCKVGSI